jgi:hypothetical protein
MASRIHSILPRLALASLLLIPIALVVLYRSFTKAYVVPPGKDIYSIVQGTWAWTTSDTNCLADPHRIAFTPDHKGMTITEAHPYKLPDGTLDSVAYYDILRVTPTSIRGAIRGETRLTDDGQPVVWDLVLKSPDRYTWHRTDWAAWEHTQEIHRCP